MTTNAIEVMALAKHYGERAAVDGLSFSVAPGEVYGMLGPNGAGKTTTVECIIGLRRPDSGRISVLGLDPAHDGSAIKGSLGVQLQSTGLFPKLTVRETMEFFAALYPKTHPVDGLLATLGLMEKAGSLVGRLSGGQRQRLTLALALLNDPQVICLDEPTAAMDPQARHQVWDLIRSLQAQGKTILLTTHYMEEAAQLCDRVAVIDRGRIVAEGKPDELVRRHFPETAIEFQAPTGLAASKFGTLAGVSRTIAGSGMVTLLTTAVPESVAALLSLSQQEGFHLDHFTVRSATLEDLFLHLTGRHMAGIDEGGISR